MALATVLEAARAMEDDTGGPTIEELYESLDLPGHRVELLEGRIVVSPAPIKMHNRIVTWLSDALRELCDQHGLDRLTHGTIELPKTSERIQPDLFICPADESTDGEWLLSAEDVLLAVEVVSPSSRRDDYVVKRASCAQSEIPLYLIIDPRESLITLFAGPSPRGYLRSAAVPIGEKLDLPEPFGIVVDTATMPGKPAEQ
ncbi:Uma2 family endonuclease [Actinomadura sp. HBU206391]|uniref:Uma2 family endonuclease n=1 Tax=Actinomadura sp. HBU206391 TaxID=2731692 RepID=UPI00164F68BB|nr:Uma2 family endonuclease [Actinomadura sp. HBU206391]MBC6459029.1 Uma2 family endonuclease [Actinomadura sp. HBU206391]